MFDIPDEEKEIARIEAESAQPDFWSDPAKAQAIMRRLGVKKNLVNAWRELEKKGTDLREMIILTIEEKDYSLKEEIQRELKKLSSRFEQLESQQLFTGDYDSRNAMVALHAGAGGTESQDWANILLRMYLRWAERHNYQAEVLDVSPGEEAGIKSAILEIKGDYVYGYLKGEHGVHRLVRLSPFDADHARHTSFVLAEVLPEAEETVDVKIAPEDLRIDTFRSSGPGGQHMQKTSSAVRITHLPTGLVATCQGQRSQHQNKEAALKILYSRLLEMERGKKGEERAKLKGERIEAGWGNQIRSYVLHPYKMVKDHRTDYEVHDAEAVLDGELDGFIANYLRSKVGR
ncbi:MAG: peptide chain release factor 2 [Dehalococcoidia bacterium]|nr:MAG: peptide chain release factor 2 [Dehalococcoidia bacterium]